MFLLILIHFSHINKNKRKYFFKISTKVTLYAIWKDTTPPTVNFSINGGTFAKPTFGDATIKTEVTANDNGSGLKTTQYIWSTSTTQPTSGWITFTNGTFISKTVL